MQWARKQTGFTIVELLIVVVVIAILAAITIVAYNGITQRSQASSVAAELSSIERQLEIAKVEGGTDTYPDPGSFTLKTSSGVTASFMVVNSTMYCASIEKNGVNYAAAKGAVPQEGECAVNLAKNPKGTGLASSYYSSGWFYPLGTTTDEPNVSWNGRSDWHRFIWTGSGNGIKRLMVDLSDLTNGASYTASVLVGNPSGSSANVSMDFSDVSSTGFSLAPGESRRISVTGSRATYSSVYRFIDIDAGPVNATGLLFTDAMLTETPAAVSFGDGDTAGWSWSGARGSSVSTGPAQ